MWGLGDVRPSAYRHDMNRDSHRSAVYAAEDQIAALLARGGEVDFFGSSITLPIERRFADVRSIQAYADAVLGLPTVRRDWPTCGAVSVRERAGSSRATYERDGSVIAIPLAGPPPRWAARELVVLHEVAHHLAYSKDRDIAAHGPEFIATMGVLVEIVIGPEVALVLRAAFDGVGV